MLKLYGFSVSNYYNMVKLALLEKGLPFEEVLFFPGPSPEALAISPRGKVPVLGVEQGFVNETSVILEYLEHSQTGTPLLSSDPFERAQALALAKEIELYIELPARACYPEAFFGASVPEAIKEKTKAELLLGFASLNRHGKFSPYVAGDSLSVADLYFLYSVPLAWWRRSCLTWICWRKCRRPRRCWSVWSRTRTCSGSRRTRKRRCQRLWRWSRPRSKFL